MIGDVELLIIDTHLPFDDNKTNTVHYYTSCLELIKSVINEEIKLNANKICFIIGDFNADIRRGKRIDNILNEFINQQKIII
jgi:hypothetical protein